MQRACMSNLQCSGYWSSGSMRPCCSMKGSCMHRPWWGPESLGCNPHCQMQDCSSKGQGRSHSPAHQKSVHFACDSTHLKRSDKDTKSAFSLRGKGSRLQSRMPMRYASNVTPRMSFDGEQSGILFPPLFWGKPSISRPRRLTNQSAQCPSACPHHLRMKQCLTSVP